MPVFISENKYKEELINKLNYLGGLWRDGDLDKNAIKKADIINSELKIAIEIKDDLKFNSIRPDELAPGKIVSRFTDLSSKNRQFKNDIKDANKKFLNYEGYKTLLIIRTEMLSVGEQSLDYVINGPLTYKQGNDGDLVFNGRPSQFWGDHDKSTSEVGGILFTDGEKYTYRVNINPNVNKSRVISKEDLDLLFTINTL